MRLILATTLLAGALAIPTASSAPITQTITYQGELSEGGIPKTGTIDVRVKIFDAAQAGAQFETRSFEDVPITRGLFTLPITLDNLIFFEGGDWWLEVAVRDGADSGVHTTLVPRQLITTVPYAINADSVDGLSASNFMRASSAADFLQADKMGAFKRVSFSSLLPGPPDSKELASLTVQAPANGSLVFRGRGYCNVSSLQGDNEVQLFIGTSLADASNAGTNYNWGRIRVPQTQDQSAQTGGFTAEDIYPVSEGESVTEKLFARQTAAGLASTQCLGTLMVEFIPGQL